MAASTAVQVVIGAVLSGTYRPAFGAAKGEATQLGRALDGLAAKRSQLSALGEEYKRVSAETRTLRQQSDLSQQRWDAAKQKVADLTKQMHALGVPTDKNGPKLERLAAALRKAQAAEQDAGYAAFVARNKFEDSARAMERAGRAAEGLTAKEARLGATLEKINNQRARIGALESKLEQTRSRRSQLRGDVVDSIALGASLWKLTTASMDWEAALKQTGTTAEMTQGQVARFGEQLTSLQDKTGQSRGDLLKGANVLLGRGLDPSDAVTALSTIGKAATATAGDIEDLSQLSYTLMRQFGIQARDLQPALDTLHKAGKMGGFELKDMAKEFPAIGAAAKFLNIQGRSGVASIASYLQVAREGAGSPEQAANNLLNFLQKMTAPEAVKKFKKLGVDVQKEWGGFVKRGENPITGMLDLVRKKTTGKNGATNPFALGQIFEDKQVQEFIKAVSGKEATDSYQKILAASANARDQIENDFATMADALKFKLKQTANETTTLLGRIADAMRGPAETRNQKQKSILVGLDEFVKEHPQVVSAIGKVAVGLVGLKIAGTAAAYGLNLIREPLILGRLWMARFALQAMVTEQEVAALGSKGTLSLLSARFAGLGTTLSTMAKGALPATSAGFQAVTSSVLASSSALLASPITWIVGGIVALLVGAGALIYKYWQPIATFFRGVGTGFGEAFHPVQAILQELGPLAGPAKQGLEAIGWALGKIHSAGTAVLGWFMDILKPVQLTSAEFFATHAAGQQLGHTIATIITGGIKALLTPLWMLGKLIDWVKSGFEGWNHPLETAGKLIGEFLGRFQGSKAQVNIGAALPSDWKQVAEAVEKPGAFTARPGFVGPPRAAAPGGSLDTLSSFLGKPAFRPAPAAAVAAESGFSATLNIYPSPGMNEKDLAAHTRREFDRMWRDKQSSLQSDRRAALHD